MRVGSPAIEINNLTVSYDGKPVIYKADADIEKEKMTAIVGPNGAGKSTLLKAILNVIEPMEGEVFFHLDDKIEANFKDVREKVAYVPQKNNVDWDFPATVLDVVLMGFYGKLGFFKRPNKNHKIKALEMLEKVSMKDYADRQISKLSGGQRQRVFIARALVQDAHILILDEPLAGVDIQTEKIIMQLLRDLVARGKTIVVVHHDLTTIEEYFDNILFLNKRILASGPINATFTQDNIRLTYSNFSLREEVGE